MFHAPTAELLGDLLLKLYDAARVADADVFQDRALHEIGRVVHFDASIWGVGTVHLERTVVKAAHLRNFAEGAVDILNHADDRNVVGKVMREQPGMAHVFSSDEAFEDADTQSLWNRLGGVKEVLCHCSLNRKAGLISFFAIARRKGGAFTQDDARWIEILAPHMEATLQACRVSELHESRAATSGRHGRRAVCDAAGMLHAAELGFAELLQEGWPGWQGPVLPRELAQLATSPTAAALCRGTVNVEMSGKPQQRIVTLSRPSPLQNLTEQERIVAEAYARGQTHKEVARQLTRSPATIRHHLRSVYEKLGVSDKGELARIIFDL